MFIRELWYLGKSTNKSIRGPAHVHEMHSTYIADQIENQNHDDLNPQKHVANIPA